MSKHCDGYTCKEFMIPIIVGKPIYQEGVKYCKACDRFLGIDGFRCPCCKNNVRCQSHHSQWRK